MIEHVYRRASDARSIASVIVATDDERIAAAVRAFGGDVRMTARDHQSGTDRLAEVAATLTAALIVNVQGDEPLIEPAMIDEAVAPFALDDGLQMSTLRKPSSGPGFASVKSTSKRTAPTWPAATRPRATCTRPAGGWPARAGCCGSAPCARDRARPR